MKKITTFLFMALLFFGGCEYDDSALNDRLDGLEDRVEQLEKLCEGFNADIVSMQTILEAIRNNDFVTSYDPILENGETVGYVIRFSKSGDITIYFGKDGSNGSDGSDGQNGYTPQIGVRQDTDGRYYWTLDGKWLLDEDGNKISAVGEDGADADGQNGQDGADGQDGQDGTDGQDGQDGAAGRPGQDGNTPLLKIEDGQWYVSYDNGEKWHLLGQAVGPEGPAGADAQSYFKAVSGDDEYVYFTLADGTVLTVPCLTEENTIQSLVYLPEYHRGVLFHLEIGISCLSDTVYFKVAPKRIVEDLLRKQEIDPNTLKGTLYSKALEPGGRNSMIDLPVADVQGDPESGILSVVFSGEKVPEDHLRAFSDDQMTLSVTYGGRTLESELMETVSEITGNYVILEMDTDFLSDFDTFFRDAKEGLRSYYDSDEQLSIIENPEEGELYVGFARDVETLRPCFRHLDRLEYVEINDMKFIADSAFFGNTSVYRVYVKKIREIGKDAFRDCTNLYTVDYNRYYDDDNPVLLEKIGERAFMNSSLGTINVGPKMTEIPAEAFRNCFKLGSLYGPTAVTVIGESAFEGITREIYEMTFPAVQVIGKNAFRGSWLGDVYFGESLTTIHAGAFFDLPSEYMDISLAGMTLPQMPDGLVFNHVPSDRVSLRLHVPEEMESVYRNDPLWSQVDCYYTTLN